MPINAVGFMYNASARTLTFRNTDGKSLSTGVGSFRCHFLPISQGLSRTNLGADSSYQAYCDGGLPIEPGDFFELTNWFGSGVNPSRRFLVQGSAQYPHRILNHRILTLKQTDQQ